jgi:hypothetical protein
LFSRVGAPPAFEVRENRCETTDMASGLAAYVRSSGFQEPPWSYLPSYRVMDRPAGTPQLGTLPRSYQATPVGPHGTTGRTRGPSQSRQGVMERADGATSNADTD